MAKLRIFRGETAHAEFELQGETARIGRGAENEIVLEDPGKGVSRTHAVLRFEDGRYILVDNKSQNGIWVAGTRLPSVVLSPDVVATIGPFRLMVETSADDTTQIPTGRHPEEAGPLATPPGPQPGEGGQASNAPLPPPLAGGPMKARRWYERPRRSAIAGAAAFLVAASGLTMYALWPERPPPFDLVAAEAMVKSGRCPDAIGTHIDPALRANPNDAVALYLRMLCAELPQPTGDTEDGPPSPVTQLLADAEASIAADDCQAGLDKITQALTIEPGNQRASQLAERAKSCLSQNKEPAPSTILAVRLPPSEGGLDVLPKELQKDYRLRIGAMRARYDAAVSALQRGEHVLAAREFERIARNVPNGYLELAQQRDAAQQGIMREAQSRLEAGQAAETRGDFDAATEAYRLAHELDPGIEIDPHMQRLAESKTRLGRKRCETGKLEFSFGTNPAAAVAAFQDVLKLLPPSDPCYAVAQERLKQLAR